jgi:uncharacterized membrane protein
VSALLAASLVLFAVFVFAIIASSTWHEWHHAYIAVPIIGAAVAALVPVWVGWVGFALLADDALQHLIQIIDPDYRSPAHLLYRTLVYNPLMRLRGRR